MTVRPGGEVRLTVKVERRNGFKGRIPLEVRGLPHGVRVLDIGLNGILITEKETTPDDRDLRRAVGGGDDASVRGAGRREGKNTEHAAKSVLLRVVEVNWEKMIIHYFRARR